MSGAGFFILLDSISPKLAVGGAAFGAVIVEILLNEADFIREYAQATAPWADRTGAARGGLDVDVSMSGGNVEIDLYHTVDYGLWLEVIQDGTYAVIMPTLEALAPMIFQSVNATYVGYSEGDT